MPSAALLAFDYTITVGGVSVNPLRDSFRIQETLDSPDTLVMDVESAAAPFFRPAIGNAVIVVENGTRIFGGTVTGIRERGFAGPNAGDLVVEIQASSYEANAERRVITKAFNLAAEGDTIGSAFAALVAEYYAAIGVTLHPAQTPGPVLPSAVFERERGDGVNKTLAASVGYLQSIDFDNRLRAWAPGEILAPQNYDEAVNPELLTGDIEVERGQLQGGYANRIILVGDPLAIPDHKDFFVGDGVTTTFPLTYKVTGPYPFTPEGAIAFGIVWYTEAGNSESIASIPSPSGYFWEFDPVANTIRRKGGPPAAGVEFYFPYHGEFVPNATAEDAAEIAQYGLWEHVEEVTAVTTAASAQEYANAILAVKTGNKEEILALTTRELGFHPGQMMTIASAARAVSGEYLITEVDTAAEAGGERLLRTLRASKGLSNTADFRRTYLQWAGASAGSGGGSSLGFTGGGGGGGGGLHGATHKFDAIDPIPNAAFVDKVNYWTSNQFFRNVRLGLQDDAEGGAVIFMVNGAPLAGYFTLGLDIGNANRAITFVGDPTLGDWFDQCVKTTCSPTFANLTVAGALTVNGVPITGSGALPPNLAYTNVANPWTVDQTFPRLAVVGSAPYGRLNIETGDNVSAISFHYPGVAAWQIGRRGTALAFANATGVGDVMGTDLVRIETSGSMRIGGSGAPVRSWLHIGDGNETPAAGYVGLVTQAWGQPVQMSVRYCSGGGASVDGGMFAHSNGNFYLGSWTNHAVHFRANNADSLIIGTDGYTRFTPAAIYVGGYRVDVTANCSIPGTGGGASLPPNMAFLNVQQNWSALQEFNQGLTWLGSNLSVYLNQGVRTDSSPTFANATIDGKLFSTYFDQPIRTDSTPTFNKLTLNGTSQGDSIGLAVTGRITATMTIEAGNAFIAQGQSGRTVTTVISGTTLKFVGGILVP